MGRGREQILRAELAGKQWVVNTVQELSSESDVSIDSWSWKQSPDDLDRGVHTLVIGSRGMRAKEKFSREELSDCADEANEEMRTQVKRRLRKLLLTGPLA